MIKLKKKYAKLTPIKFVGIGKNKAKFHLWLFRCDCGKEIVEALSVVHRGRRISCGCSLIGNQHNRQHGYKNSRIYRIWSQMKVRSLNPNHIAYDRYGGRGIKLCKRWHHFVNFLKDMGHPPSSKHTLDRLDNNKGYSKANCRWATKLEQNRNARTNVRVKFKGQTKCLSEWAEYVGIPYLRLWARYRKHGWAFKRALYEPIHKEKARY